MQRIERREFKYIVDEAMAARVRRAIAPYCLPDPNAAKLGGRYLIDSLYLDSPGLECYWAVEHELVDRFKLRVRTYPETPSPYCYLEVKRRVGDVIAKTRSKVAGDWRAHLSLANASAEPGIAAFALRHGVLDARPVACIRYQREPYFSVYDEYARVTFDRDIRYRCALPGASDESWESIDDPISMRDDSSLIVLELKFSTQVPLWMVAMVRALELQRRSFSKYGRAVEALRARRGFGSAIALLGPGLRQLCA